MPNLGDGLCAIDVIMRPGFDHDTATNDDISIAADIVLDRCVRRDSSKSQGGTPIGGIITNVG